MDADEKLMELKKAYADIILNISKEAAARVMASEKKALRYEHELKVAKEEALQMLVRLKQMIDSKITKAEMSLLKKQKKIEELEAQVWEGEDIMRGLSEELRDVHYELDSYKNEKVQEACESNIFCLIQIPTENKIYSYPSKPQGEFYAASECGKCYNKEVCKCRSYIENRDFPGLLYKNGHREFMHVRRINWAGDVSQKILIYSE